MLLLQSVTEILGVQALLAVFWRWLAALRLTRSDLDKTHFVYDHEFILYISSLQVAYHKSICFRCQLEPTDCERRGTPAQLLRMKSFCCSYFSWLYFFDNDIAIDRGCIVLEEPWATKACAGTGRVHKGRNGFTDVK